MECTKEKKMTEQLKGLSVDCSTGIVIEKDLTEIELEQIAELRQKSEEEFAQMQANADSKAAAKASALAKLTALGLTPEEAAAL
jgi:hypothetical protein